MADSQFSNSYCALNQDRFLYLRGKSSMHDAYLLFLLRGLGSAECYTLLSNKKNYWMRSSVEGHLKTGPGNGNVLLRLVEISR
jgi:hypothetical protein